MAIHHAVAGPLADFYAQFQVFHQGNYVPISRPRYMRPKPET